MFKANEETKSSENKEFKAFGNKKPHPFSTIHSHIPACCKCMSPLAEAEWKIVKTPAEAKIWHLKWTPWLTPECIDGILKFHYLPILTKPQEPSSKNLWPMKAPSETVTEETNSPNKKHKPSEDIQK